MKYRYKIKVEFDEEFIIAHDKQEAIELFWDNKIYPNTDLEHILDENTTIERVDFES